MRISSLWANFGLRSFRGPAVAMVPQPIGPIRHVIDCDTVPTTIPGNRWTRPWSAIEHMPGGQFEWNPMKIVLRSPHRARTLEEFYQELAGEPVLNANVLDYLLAHPELIPEEWQKLGEADDCSPLIYFFGAVYDPPYFGENPRVVRSLLFGPRDCSCGKSSECSDSGRPHAEGCDLGQPWHWWSHQSNLSDQGSWRSFQKQVFVPVYAD